MNISIPASMLKVSDRALIQAALPVGYSFDGGKDNQYRVYDGPYRVASVEVVEGEVVFETDSSSRGEEFQRKLVTLFPENDPRHILWQVFFDWQSAWAFVGVGVETKEKALKSISQNGIDLGAYLCSYRRGDWGNDSLTVLSSFRILDKDLLGEDEGAKTFAFTHLELAKKVEPLGGMGLLGLNEE